MSHYLQSFVDPELLFDILSEMSRREARVLHELTLSYDDRRLAWHRFMPCDAGGAPALDRGQSCDCRWEFGNKALHAHWDDARRAVRFHIDRYHPGQKPAAHLLHETYVPHGAAAGALIGSRLGPLGIFLGALVGGAVGTQVDRKPPKRWILYDVDPYGGWELVTQAEARRRQIHYA